MSSLLLVIAWFALILLLLPGIFWLAEVILGLLPRQSTVPCDENPSAVVLIPAHNEEQVILETLKNLASHISEVDKVLVIADNCQDKTAEIARQFGFDVTERSHDTERGKGYALAHGTAEIQRRSWAPDVVVVLDADCIMRKGGFRLLKQRAKLSPVQGRYLLTAPEGAGPKQKVSAFAIYIKNHIRLLGLTRLGGSVPITGSGFGAPLTLFLQADLASGEIVEDMKLGCDWAFANQFTVYEPDAHILSPLPTNDKDADTQRERWEHGHLSIIQRYMPKLLAESVKRLRLDYFFTAMDMAIPPLTSMLAAYLILAMLLVLFWPLGAFAVGLLIVLILTSLVLVNRRANPRLLKWVDIWGGVKFAASKLSLYAKLARGEKSGWVKARRSPAAKIKENK